MEEQQQEQQQEQEQQVSNFKWYDKPREVLTKFPKLYESMNYANASKTFSFGYLHGLLVFILCPHFIT